MADDFFVRARSTVVPKEEELFTQIYNVVKSRYENRPLFPARAFNASSYGSVSLWLRSSNGINGSDVLPADGTPVSSWTDLSGDNHGAIQALGSKQPTFKTNILGTTPAVRFDGVDDFMTSYTLVAGNYTYLMVIVPRVLREGYQMSGLLSAGSYLYQGIYQSSGQAYYYGYFGNGGSIQGSGYTFNVGQPYLLTLLGIRNGNAYGYINGNQRGSVATTFTNTPTFPFYIGGTNQNNYFANWDLLELVLYDEVLSIVSQQNVEDSIAYKYNITISR